MGLQPGALSVCRGTTAAARREPTMPSHTIHSTAAEISTPEVHTSVVQNVAIEAAASQVLAAAEPTTGATPEIQLPDPDAPAINTSQPEVSFKIDFSDKSQWFASEDGCATKQPTESPTLIGCPIDLALQISKASWGDGYDQRLRLALSLLDADGETYIGELNLNAVNRAAEGDVYVTSPVRSLCGGLLAIIEAHDDMAAFCRLARFSIKPGRGRGVFIDVDIPAGRHWLAMSAASRTNQIHKHPSAFHAQLALIKQRFCSCGLLLSNSAVVGDINGYDNQQGRLLNGKGD